MSDATSDVQATRSTSGTWKPRLRQTTRKPRGLSLDRYFTRAGDDPYEAWAAGVRSGNVVVSNGPLVEISADQATGRVRATAAFFRPLENLEIIQNGKVVAAVPGDGKRTQLSAEVTVSREESSWVAARTKARKEEAEPDIQAHTNPVYLLRDGKPVMVRAARETVAAQWEAELANYRNAPLVFPKPEQKQEFFEQAERALRELRRPL